MDVEARLGRLERSVRRWKLAACLLGGLGLLGAAQAPKLQEITCSKLEVLGPGGRSGITLEVDKDGNPDLTMRDDGRRVRVGLGLDPLTDTASMALIDRHRRHGVLLTQDEDLGSSIMVLGRDGRYARPVLEPVPGLAPVKVP